MKHSVIVTSLGMALVGAVQAQEPVWDANKVVLESQKLAEGVFAVIPKGAEDMAVQGVAIATTSGFVLYRYLLQTCFGQATRLSPQHLRYPGYWTGIFWKPETRCRLCSIPTIVKPELCQVTGR